MDSLFFCLNIHWACFIYADLKYRPSVSSTVLGDATASGVTSGVKADSKAPLHSLLFFLEVFEGIV